MIEQGAYLEAFYTADLPNNFNGFVVPLDNVATEDRGALIDFVVNSQIIIHLKQRYYIGPLRIPFLEEGKITPQFYIETSENWTMTVDKRNEELESSPVFQFTPRLVVFVKLNSAIEVKFNILELFFQEILE